MKLWLQEDPACAVSVIPQIKDLGLMRYRQAHETQINHVELQLSEQGRAEVILIVEHPPVFTLGRKGSLSGLVKKQEDILRQGVEIVHTERGGDVTYHGPGQLVVYPILNLHRRRISVTRYIHLLEETMIKVASEYGVCCNRDERNRGVWVGNNKLGSVGIRIRHGVTYHGLSLNVDILFEHFRWIQPCGLAGVGVTSLARESTRNLNMTEVKERMRHHLLQNFQ